MKNLNDEYYIRTKPNLSKRVLSAIIDYGIISSYTILMIYLYEEPHEEGGYSVNGWPGFSITVIWFIFTIGIEQMTGATIGNHSQNLRAIPKNYTENNLTFSQSLKRHLLDPIDLWPFGLLAILTIKNTEYNQCLGDLWAKTIVLDKTDSEQGIKLIDNTVGKKD